MPDHRGGLAVHGRNGCNRGRVNGCARMQHAAQAAAAGLPALGAGLVALGAACPTIAMADYGRCKRVGGSNTCRPAGCDRSENLHRQRNQDYGQKVLQPPAHRKTHPRATIAPCQVQSRDGAPGLIPHVAMWHQRSSAGRRHAPRPGRKAGPIPLPRCGFFDRWYNRRWRNSNHFAVCLNFEQSLPKMVTRRKR